MTARGPHPREGEDPASNKQDGQTRPATPEQRRRIAEFGRVPIAQNPDLTYDDAASWIEGEERRHGLRAIHQGPSKSPVLRAATPGRGVGRRTAAEVLVGIALSAELFHDSGGNLFATVEVAGHRETYRLRSPSFRRWLAHQFAETEHEVPSAEALSSAYLAIEAEAQFKGPEREVYLRVAPWDSDLWIDVGDAAWSSIRVTAAGWSVEKTCPIRFVRGKNSLPLPAPERGGNLLELLPFLNAGAVDDPHFVLAVGWMVGSFHPTGPYPVFDIFGEQGAGKTSGALRMRSLCDPSSAPVRSVPRDERDLAIYARNSWVLLFDNLSAIPSWLSDALCRLSTGGGFSTRALYTDDDEFTFTQKRPIIVTGIPVVTEQADLLDRAIPTEWPVQTALRTEAVLDADFVKVAGRIFGALLDALVSAVKGHRQTSTTVVMLPRMADFFAWVVAAEPHLPWSAGTFAKVYASNRARSVESIIAGSAIAEALIALVTTEGSFENTPTRLLEALGRYATPPVEPNKRPPYGWPKRPSELTTQLRRLVPNLRRVGISVKLDIKVGHARTRQIRVGSFGGKTASAASASATTDADAADDKSTQFSGPPGANPGPEKQGHVRSGETRSETDPLTGEVYTVVFDSIDGRWHRLSAGSK